MRYLTIDTATFTLGSFTYTTSGYSIFTNAGLPASGCFGVPPEGEAGLIQFWFDQSWLEEPGAWSLNGFGLLHAGYYDLIVKDGTLPMAPTYDPNSGMYGGTQFNPLFIAQSFESREPVTLQAVDLPAVVPEPATLTMFGIGLASLAAARKRRKI